MFTGLPAVAVLAATMLLFTTGGTVAVPPGYRSLLFIVTLTVGLFPPAVLVAFILRMATVTRRTVTTLPFRAPAQEYH